jgi:DNA-directed RNA polymerase subunit RPC12/RpoP
MPTFSNCCGADEYICQNCGKILCSKCYPPAWNPDFIGNTTAANACPKCQAQFVAQNNPPMVKVAKVWSRIEVEQLLRTNQKMVERSLMKMWALQTSSEQDSKETQFINGCGFNKPDGVVLSRFVENLQRYGSFKSDKQVAYVRKKLLKYVGQLTKIANGQIEEPKNPQAFRSATMRNRTARQRYGFTRNGSGYYGKRG